MLDDILYIFEKNFERLNGLISLYQSITGAARGRRTTNSLDLLRATVVITHSTLEDFIRSLMAWKLPLSNDVNRFNQISLTGTGLSRKTKFELGELLQFRGRTIDSVIHQSVKEHLNLMSFNNPTDLISAITSIGINVNHDIQNLLPTLEEMIQRRHTIVHQADRNMAAGPGFQRIASISLNKVNLWKNSVDQFANLIVQQL